MAPSRSRKPVATVALCHEWLAERRGSEKTFEAMARTLPAADLHALTRDPGVEFAFGGRHVSTTFLDRIGVLRDHRALQLPLMPLAWRYVSRRRYDLVVTSSHACAKGFWPGRDALHLCYCYTPMRYVWLPSLDERRRSDIATRVAARALRSWELTSTTWVDEFAAISSTVQARIEAFYARPARIIHPPVDTDYFTPLGDGSRGEFALAVARMVPYKRLDLVIRACHALRYPLVLAGAGPEEPHLRSLAATLGASVEFVIAPGDDRLRQLYRTARVSVFPALEDFGIAPVEAQACGAPVVALGQGGSVDIVLPGVTGVLVERQDHESLRAGMETALEGPFDESKCRRNAERFSVERFRTALGGWVRDAAAGRGWDVEGLIAAPGR